MDLERLKQNLRLRSGRSRKLRERQKQPLPPGANPSSVVRTPRPEPPPTKTIANDERSHTENTRPKNNKTSSAKADTAKKDTQPPPAQNRERKAPEIAQQASSSQGDQSSPSEEPKKQSTERTTMAASDQADYSDGSEGQDFDLRPPAPKAKRASLETTAELLFSSGHLNAILHDQQSVARFTAFLNKYKPEYKPLILGYLETRKAIAAIEYANAVAASAVLNQSETSEVTQISSPRSAAKLDQAFEDASKTAFNALVGTALPMFITYSLIKVVSECLTDEMMGKQSTIMQSLVGGLSEVFCLTDPSQPDNPIIYASEEFYRYTGYGRDDVIGHNCRFLQGPKTSRDSPRRLKEATQKGEETCEALLNYRRDGRPFINLLMIAPLYDNRGKVKYQIGAQVDVSGLVENGRGLDFFARYLETQQSQGRNRGADDDEKKQAQLDKLRELSEMFDLEESAVVQTHSRSNSLSRDDDSRSTASTEKPKALRRLFVSDSGSDNDDDDTEATEPNDSADAWRLGQEGPDGRLSGGLPGVYDTYMLIRPAPSLRIIFVSPKLQKHVRSVQTRFMSHIAGPSRTLAGLKESFITGVPVSAKISFRAEATKNHDGTKIASGYKHEDGELGKACWISATPLLGSDDRPGVWMVVFVDKATSGNRKLVKRVEAEAKTEVTAASQRSAKNQDSPIDDSKKPSRHDLPIKPVRLNSHGPAPTEGNDQKTTGATPTAAPTHPTEDTHKSSGTKPIKADDKTTSAQKPEVPPSTRTPHTSDPIADVQSPVPARQTTSDSEPVATHETISENSKEEILPKTEDSKEENLPKTPPVTDQHSNADLGAQDSNAKLQEESKSADNRRIDRVEADDEDPNATPVATRVHTRSSSPDRGKRDMGTTAPEVEPTPPSQSTPPAVDHTSKTNNEDDADDSPNEYHDTTPIGSPQHTLADSTAVTPPEASNGEEGFDLDTPKKYSDLGRQSTVKHIGTCATHQRSASGLVIDYLTHPGSSGPVAAGRSSDRVNAEEFGRALLDRRQREGGGDDGGRSNTSWDEECLRSPYSVD